jgi:hypothetical protein
MIIMTPLGGHGSTYILGRNPGFLKRPDTAFGVRYRCVGMPAEESTRSLKIVHKQWRTRTGRRLDVSKTIEQNLLDILDSDTNVMLCGSCSSVGPFLTRNKLRALCIVRHPLHAYVSFLKNRHPNHARQFGGYDTEEAIAWWATIWNSIVDDMLSSGSDIHQYERLPGEIRRLLRIDRGWDGSKRNHGALTGFKVTKLKLLTESRFYQIYDEWSME